MHLLHKGPKPHTYAETCSSLFQRMAWGYALRSKRHGAKAHTRNGPTPRLRRLLPACRQCGDPGLTYNL